MILNHRFTKSNFIPGLFFSKVRNSAKVILGMFCSSGSTDINADRSDSLAFCSVIITLVGTVRSSESSLKSLDAFKPSSYPSNSAISIPEMKVTTIVIVFNFLFI